jgi:hypothetical protein
LHCIASAFGDGYGFDEVCMLAIGRNHLEWGSADHLDGYSERYQLPDAYSANRSYGSFPPPADHDSVLYIGREPRVGDVGEDMHAYLLTGQRQSLDEIWPRVRTLTVS